MFTPKRIVLLFSTLFVIIAVFAVYAWFLGGIDGLPVLPKEYFPVASKGNGKPVLPPPPRGEHEVDRKLRLAFGAGCRETDRPIKAEMSKRQLTFATEQIIFQEDGRLRLETVSLAIFNKRRPSDAVPEINTVRAKKAILTFDRPIKNRLDMGDRKIVGAELSGNITIVNNRRTPQRNDDVIVFIAKGPLVFSDKHKLVVTDDYVRLTDTLPQPKPTIVMAKGMQIHLNKNVSLTGQDTPQAKSKTSDNAKHLRSVERIVLLSNVNMSFTISPGDGFLAGMEGAAGKRKRADAQKKDEEVSYVSITTEGAFTYDLGKDFALFESRQFGKKSKRPGFPSGKVQVTRLHSQGVGILKKAFKDHLLCDRLELQFREEKNSVPRLRPERENGGKEIASARALARPGREVTIALNKDNLEARGAEMIYRAPTAKGGAETILRGTKKDPMWAAKDAHEITCPELHLVAADESGKGRHASATGPGRIDLMDHNSQSKVHQYHATWSKSLTIAKDTTGKKELDLLTFDGNAAFIDDAGEQKLSADKLQVWIEPAERTRTAAKDKAPNKVKSELAARQQPHKLEGFGNVQVTSPKVKVSKCNYLVVIFKDGISKNLPPDLPVAVGDNANSRPDHVVQKTGQTHLILLPPESSKGGDKKGKPAAKLTGNSSEKDDQRKSIVPSLGRSDYSGKPIELEAPQVFVHIVRTGKKNDLEHLVSKGGIHVHQDGKTAEDRGFDVYGQMLELYHDAEGNKLIVIGNSQIPARMQSGKMMLVGPTVTIDQKTNEALIDGAGAMRLPSNTSFEGEKTKRKDTMVTIHWTDHMFFDGLFAVFYGQVSANQEKAWLRCKELSVTLDRKVSFKDGQKQAKGAKVERFVCKRQVDVFELRKNAADQVEKLYRLLSTELTADNQSGPINAAGPGRVFIYQKGQGLDLAEKKDNLENAKMYLTRVDYTGRLYSIRYADKRRVAKFFDNVEVVHVPTATPNIKIDPNKLPEGSFYLRCGQLFLESIPGPKDKTWQVMHALKGVTINADQFHGTADELHYDQRSDNIIFKANKGNLVRLFRFVGRGLPHQELTGETIIYSRRNQTFSVKGSRGIRGTQ